MLITKFNDAFISLANCHTQFRMMKTVHLYTEVVILIKFLQGRAKQGFLQAMFSMAFK